MARRPEFHTLKVATVDRLTDDSVALTFAVPGDLRDDYLFSAGQHVTLRCLAAGDDARRTYSLCSVPGTVRVGVKQVAGGVFSTHALGALRAGDDVEVMTPMGRFTTDIDPSRRRHRAAIVAGSGMTPVLSIMATTLEQEHDSSFTLIYANRTTRSVMFLDEIADLKDRFPGRLTVFHVLSREPRESPLLSGRIDGAKLDQLLQVVDPATVDEWFLCGPMALVDESRAVLRAHGVVDSDVRFELFYVAPTASATSGELSAPSTAMTADALDGASTVTIVLAGRTTTLLVEPTRDVLHAAMMVRPDVPYGCTNGMCGTCRAKLVEGKVEMDHCYALDDAELAAGFVLTCQAQPRSEIVVLDYDA